jgi:recombination protein RecR
MFQFPEELLTLISHLKKLPGVGTKTAERFAFELLNWPKEELSALGDTLQTLRDKISPCPTCGCLTQELACHFCNHSNRDTTQLCILSSPRDVYAIESTKSYKGIYHIIEHLLSPLDGRHIADLRVDKIENRIAQLAIQEVIIALDSTLEGDTTALYLKNQLSKLNVKVSRLAFGLPLGSSLEYIDSGTLSRSLVGRQIF